MENPNQSDYKWIINHKYIVTQVKKVKIKIEISKKIEM